MTNVEFNIDLFAKVLVVYFKQFGGNEDDFRYCVNVVKDKLDFMGLHDKEIEKAVRIAKELLN